MEVILRDHVENVGKRGEVVKVANGYARNYLLPRKLALVATPGNLKQVERERVKLDAVEAEEKGAADAIAAKMAGLEVVISRKVGETEALYGSVTSADIADALAAKGFDVDKRKIGLREPIKKLGSQTVPLKLHREVVVQVPVRVVAEGKPEVTPAELKAARETATAQEQMHVGPLAIGREFGRTPEALFAWTPPIQSGTLRSVRSPCPKPSLSIARCRTTSKQNAPSSAPS